MKTHFPFPLLALLGILATLTTAQARVSAFGSWEFDTSREKLYTNSVKAAQTGGDLSEIASQMGRASYENSIFEFNFDKKGPYLRIKDKATNKSQLIYLSVKRDGQILHMKSLDGANTYRVEPAGENAITLYDKGKGLTIPLRRLS